MSIMDMIFGRTPAATPAPTPAAAPAAPAAPANNPATGAQPATAHSSQQTAPNGVVPPEDPLAKYAELWTPPKDGETTAGLTIDPNKLMEAARGVDFVSRVPAETLAKLQNGGPEAAQALQEILQHTSREVYGSAAVAAANLAQRILDARQDTMLEQMQKKLRADGLRNDLMENPAFRNPAVSSLIELQSQQLALKFPQATPAELRAMAQEYLKGIANTINPPAKPAASSGSGKVDDWSDL